MRGYLPDVEATLTDDGVQVQTGMTGAGGSVQLADTPASEGGIYRALTITVGAQSASTDAENRSFLCLATSGTGTGSVSVTETVVDEDANSSAKR